MLSRAECLKILELGPKANSYEIENRYTLLIKRYRGKEDPETLATLDQITLAYNILTGRYVEPEPVDPRLETVVFGKTRRQWRNIWHYGKVPFLAGLAGLSLLVYLIYTIATNEPADFQLAVTGLYGATDNADERIDAYVKSVFPDMDEIEYQAIPIDLRDPAATNSSETSGIAVDAESNYAYAMKMMTLVAGDTIEVYVCDKPVFDSYAPQGAFADLTSLYDRLRQALPSSVYNQIKPLRRQLSDGSDNEDIFSTETKATTQSTEDAANADASLAIYGLDVSALHLTEGLGLYSDVQILTIGCKTDIQDKAETFLETWIRDYEKMHQMRQEYEASVKAALQTTTAQTTAGVTSSASK